MLRLSFAARTSLVATLAALAVGSACAAEVQSEKDARDDCSGDSQAQMTQCLHGKLAAAQDALKSAHEKARVAITAWVDDDKYHTAALARLATADQAFEKYRAAQCAFNRSLGGGAIGNALDMRSLACEVELDLRRADQLEQLASTLHPR